MTSNIVTATAKIKGTRPLWQHKFGPDAIPLEKQERTGVAGNDPEEWRKTCCVDENGQLYLDGSYVFATLRGAAIYTKSGKSSIQKQLSSTLQIFDPIIFLDRWYPGFPNGCTFDASKIDPCSRDLKQPVYIDVRGVVNPSTKGRNVHYRLACSPGWNTEFSIMWDKTIINRSQMESVIIDAGKLIGLANGRTVGMGRFDLVEFIIKE